MLIRTMVLTWQMLISNWPKSFTSTGFYHEPKVRLGPVQEVSCTYLFVPRVIHAKSYHTDKRTDSLIWKINFGLWAVAWAGLWDKRVWADYEQLLRPVFSLFGGQKNWKSAEFWLAWVFRLCFLIYLKYHLHCQDIENRHFTNIPWNW